MARLNCCYSYDDKADDCPLISVVVAVYNGSLYLGETIQSVLDQTFKDFELILVDDCSTDNSVDIIKSYTDPRIKLVQNSQNLGVVKNTNLGFAIARGRYIALLGHDDICVPERLQTQYDCMENNPSISFCGSWMETFGSTNQIITYPNKQEVINSKLLFSTTFGAPSVMMRKRDFWENKLIYRDSYKCAEDYDLWVRASIRGLKSTNIPQVLVKYRVHDKQMSNKFSRNQAELTSRIQLYQLQRMGIEPSMEELQIHYNLIVGRVFKGDGYLQKVKQWLLKIDQVNQKGHIYSQDDLRVVLNYYWKIAYEKFREISSVS
jgi:glycosyltransferase involved in cell wall biosynthesis